MKKLNKKTEETRVLKELVGFVYFDNGSEVICHEARFLTEDDAREAYYKHKHVTGRTLLGYKHYPDYIWVA